MRRAEATRRLEGFLRRTAAGGRYARRITQIWVFGSYARGAPNVGDIDLDVEYEHDEELTHEVVRALSYGRDPYADANCAGRSGPSNPLPREGGPQARVWGTPKIYERGDSLRPA